MKIKRTSSIGNDIMKGHSYAREQSWNTYTLAMHKTELEVLYGHQPQDHKTPYGFYTQENNERKTRKENKKGNGSKRPQK